MILAAAIKIHVESTDTDVILCAARHYEIYNQLKNLGFKPKEGYKEINQGFIDNHNNFLDRKEAYKHAYECGQIHSKTISNDELFSEDLW